MTHEVDLLYVCRIVIINTLGQEIVIPRTLWVEFEADYAETLSLNEAHIRICSECLGRILQDFVVNWSVARVGNLDGLINGFVWTARWEGHSVLGR